MVGTSPSPPDAGEPSSRSARPAGAFVLAALLLTVTLGAWRQAHEIPAGDASPTPVVSPTPADAGIGLIKPVRIGRLSRIVEGVPFSFRVPTHG